MGHGPPSPMIAVRTLPLRDEQKKRVKIRSFKDPGALPPEAPRKDGDRVPPGPDPLSGRPLTSQLNRTYDLEHGKSLSSKNFSENEKLASNMVEILVADQISLTHQVSEHFAHYTKKAHEMGVIPSYGNDDKTVAKTTTEKGSSQKNTANICSTFISNLNLIEKVKNYTRDHSVEQLTLLILAINLTSYAAYIFVGPMCFNLLSSFMAEFISVLGACIVAFFAAKAVKYFVKKPSKNDHDTSSKSPDLEQIEHDNIEKVTEMSN